MLELNPSNDLDSQFWAFLFPMAVFCPRYTEEGLNLPLIFMMWYSVFMCVCYGVSTEGQI